MKSTDARVVGAALYLLPVHTRVPLKFGNEVVTYVTCARAKVRLMDRQGRSAWGWGETPLSVQWVWPSALPYELRHNAMKEFCSRLARLWVGFNQFGHPMEIGWDFQEAVLRKALDDFNIELQLPEPMPWLAALVCCSVFDLAVHDAFGRLHDQPVFQTYNERWMSRPLSEFFTKDERDAVKNTFPDAYLQAAPARRLPAWHLVGGLDLLDRSELTGSEINDGYPVVLTDWIKRDGLRCLKIKLRGNDSEWDYERLLRIGRIALTNDVEFLSTDFNCTVRDAQYVNEILDRLQKEAPAIFSKVLYVEQPFPYELEHHRIDVRSVSRRKPLFLDESAHDWRLVKLGRELGWTGVALKTCKTQTGAILSACWARAHGMGLMVQDLTNPMLAQIPHLQLAAHVGTIMGVETNAMQFYPEASAPEAQIHPGIYRRRDGEVDLSTLNGPGFGYGAAIDCRDLGPAVESVGT